MLSSSTLHLLMKFFSRDAGVLWMEWMFLFTRSSTDEVAALSSFMLLYRRHDIRNEGTLRVPDKHNTTHTLTVRTWPGSCVWPSWLVQSPSRLVVCTSARCSLSPPLSHGRRPSSLSSSSPALRPRDAWERGIYSYWMFRANKKKFFPSNSRFMI